MRLWYKYFRSEVDLNLVRKPNSNLNFGALSKYLPLREGRGGESVRKRDKAHLFLSAGGKECDSAYNVAIAKLLDLSR